MTTLQSAPRTWHPDSRSHDIEKYGSGYLRVRREIADYPTMTFDYRESGDGYLARLEYSEQRTETTPKTTLKTTPKTTPKTRDRLLDLMRENPRITREEMAVDTGVSVNGIKQHLATLKKEGLLRRIGNNRTGYWEV
jgi:ATP-dependent DNA helicase RecG